MPGDERWSDLEPLIEAWRRHATLPSPHLRRTVEAILRRHQNGAKRRSPPAEFGPWRMAAQTFIRGARLGVWEKRLPLAQERGVRLGMAFPDGTNVRAHRQAPGAGRKGDLQESETAVKRLADLRAPCLAAALDRIRR